ncbi:polyphosphate kinase [Anaerospora hongkongensis]|uniref:Polyphosphate kinase n=1 Tax=Anaerospora hongkongensis TaxID=244830 RepID=A0A4R1PZ37_9FIRM|nr:polyphosphate kinase [Anaerospora hongkongensis]
MNTLFDQHEFFLNRELSWLKFNSRVLQEADDPNKPLLDRLRFIAIVSSNLDEFFMIRVAGLKHQKESGINKMDNSGLTVLEQLERIAGFSHQQVKVQYKYLQKILSLLEEQDIHFLDVQDLTDKNREWLYDYFLNTIYPVTTPMAVDASHPFPFLASRGLNLAVLLEKDKGEVKTAVVPVPTVLPRIVEIPGQEGKKHFVFLENIMQEYCHHLFHGYRIKEVAPFRITRNADLSIAEEEAVDLLAEVEKSLQQRRKGQPVRLEIGKRTNKAIRDFVVGALKLEEQDIYEIMGPLDNAIFAKFADLPGYDHLRYQPINPQIPPRLKNSEEIFAAIREKDILIHHPYEAFDPVVNFVMQGATDPKVLAIKQTLYRVGGNSAIVGALAEAAKNGKQVTVLVELKARFDEENNIIWARRLEEAGCHVIYGLVGLKTHAKCTLVVRRESYGIKRYVHVGTGNYNDFTAKIYTDIGLFTANDQIGADASAFFNLLSGYSDPPIWNKFIVAPLGLREKLIQLIDQEIQAVDAGRPGRIIAKMNSLLDREIIIKLYEASAKGVKIDLIVRGICVLRPGLPGVSDNITVRSIVGRFLEHSRIFYFANGGDSSVFLSSADWMPRNLNERVELMVPIQDNDHKDRIKEILELILKDNLKAHVMKKDGSYRKVEKRSKAINSQEKLYEQAVSRSEVKELTIEQRLRPSYRH